MTITKIEGSRQLRFQGNMTMLDSLDGTTMHRIVNLGDPVDAYDAINKNYLEATLATLTVKDSVRAITTAELVATYDNGTAGEGATLTADSAGFIADSAASFDDVVLVEGDRVLVTGQTDKTQNGIYVVTDAGAAEGNWVLTRSTDCDEGGTELRAGVFVFVTEGTDYADTGWLMISNNPIVIGDDDIEWEQAAGSGLIGAGEGLVQNGTNFDINVDGSSHLEIVSDVLRVTSDVIVNADIVVRETPSGTVNGSNTAFTLAGTPIAGSESVYLNGLLQDVGGGNDYTISGATITFVQAPVSGDRIRVNYFK